MAFMGQIPILALESLYLSKISFFRIRKRKKTDLEG